MKNKTITFRLSGELHQKCLNIAISKTQREGRIVQLSEIIRDMIEEGLQVWVEK